MLLLTLSPSFYFLYIKDELYYCTIHLLNYNISNPANFAINQNKIIGCYKPSEKYNKEKSVEGNLYLLKNKSIHTISNLESLNKFILKLEEELDYENFMFIEKSTQLKFII